MNWFLHDVCKVTHLNSVNSNRLGTKEKNRARSITVMDPAYSMLSQAQDKGGISQSLDAFIRL